MPNLKAYNNSQVECPVAPYTLFVEPTNHCNLKCTFCPQKDQKRSLGFLDVGLFRELTEEAAQIGVRKFNLFFLGESLMHKSLFEMIRLAKSNGIQTRLNTNASFLDNKRAEELLETGLDLLTVSFEGVNKEIYERLRVKGNFERTSSNIRNVIKLKHRKKSDTQISIEIIDLPETSPYMKDFTKTMQSYGPDEIVTKVYRNWIGYLKAQKNLALEDHYNVCSYPWRSMALLWDGTFVPCCVDYDGRYPLGNAKDGIMNAWNGEPMKKLRQYLIDRKNDLRKHHGQRECHGLCSVCDIPFQADDHRVQ
tara:strand:- start:49 stop:972 length:924 start_codon:yes stop_codon:yes gene_type:complete